MKRKAGGFALHSIKKLYRTHFPWCPTRNLTSFRGCVLLKECLILGLLGSRLSWVIGTRMGSLLTFPLPYSSCLLVEFLEVLG
jgi:hypothetical protein